MRRGESQRRRQHAVLAVHGFTDYFFHTELADHFASRGFAFYALDLHKCGRSWREGQTPHFTTDLARYDAELVRALDVIDAGSSAEVLVYGHSAGGLIVSLWLDRMRSRGPTATQACHGLVLNSPWLDLQGPAFLRTVATARRSARCRGCARSVVRPPAAEGGYGTTLHRDYHGEFDYDLRWKPIGGFPGHVRLDQRDRRGHARLHRGLDVGVPNLILRSDRSVREVADPDSSSAATRCWTSSRSPAGPDASATGPRSYPSPTPSTTCSCRWRNRARPPTVNWTAGWTGTPMVPSRGRQHNPNEG